MIPHPLNLSPLLEPVPRADAEIEVEVGGRDEPERGHQLEKAVHRCAVELVGEADGEAHGQVHAAALIVPFAMSPMTAIVPEAQLQFWKWMANYYCCTTGEVMNVAMPASLKLESETRVVLDADTISLHEIHFKFMFIFYRFYFYSRFCSNS